jgi:heme-degrading monooxygenase HmoA
MTSSSPATPPATPLPPYYAVILSSQLKVMDPEYARLGRRMQELAAQQPGFLGYEGAHSANGFGISVSYWESLEAIAAWRADAEHRVVQTKAQRDWYQHYSVRVARVERAYGAPAV